MCDRAINALPRAWLQAVLAAALGVMSVILAACHPVAAAEGDRAEPALVVGIAVWPGHDITRAQVQLYRDAECAKLAYASRKVGREGTYAIIVTEPGTYYARLLVDDNASGAADASDGIGFYGLESPAHLDRAPRPITLTAGDVMPDVIIRVIATVGADGRPRPLKQGALLMATPTMMLGTVVWPGHDLRNARVRLFTDEGLSKVACESPPVEPGGSFAFLVDPGTYYACVTVDVDSDGKFGPGDAVGYYGVTDMTDASQRPKPVRVVGDADPPHLTIAVSAVMTDAGKLRAVEVPATVGEAAASGGSPVRVAGAVMWPGHTFERTWVVAARRGRLSDIAAATRPAADSGQYVLRLPPGEYAVAALVDANGSGRLDAGDCIGFCGGETLLLESATPVTIRAESGKPVADADVHIAGRLTDAGEVVPLVGGAADGPVAKLDLSALPALVSGHLVWEGTALRQGTMTFFRNKGLSELAAIAPAGSDGSYAVVLAPGTYYVMAGADMDGDNAMSTGDGVGVYGASRMAASGERQPVALEAAALHGGLDVRVTDVVGDDGTLRAAGR